MPAAAPARPRPLVVAGWWWALCTVAVGIAAVASWVVALRPGGELPWAQDVLAAALTALALVLAWGTLRLALGHLAGRLTLTACGLIGGVPLLFTGRRFILVALVLLVGVALLYLPACRAYFRDQSRARRAVLRAQRGQERALRRKRQAALRREADRRDG